jgi:PAS domain-containing protein
VRYAREELVGRPVGDVLHFSGADAQLLADLRARQRAGRGFAAELLHRHKDGQCQWVAARANRSTMARAP